MRVVEEVPAELSGEVDAALAWLSARHGRSLGLSGLVDPEGALAARGRPHPLSLIVCDGDLCLREQLEVRPTEGGFAFRAADSAREDPPAELDPRPGARHGWLDAVRARHAFVVLVFYRGFW